jgi:O-succinylbenzoate synthase
MASIKIENIQLRLIKMPLRHPFQTSFGIEKDRQCIIVSVQAKGLTGWGECVASQFGAGEGPEHWAFYSYETTGTAWHILKDFLAPALIGKEITSPSVVADLHARLRGHPMACAGIEAAIWDLLAQAEGIPLADLLYAGQGYTSPRPERVQTGVSIGIQPSIEATLQRIAAFVAEGYGRVKLKIKPGWDIDLVSAVRADFPDLPLMLDANSAYTLADAEHLKKLDAFNLTMIEQPLAYDDIFQHAKLQAQLETPICLDESIHSLDQAAWAYEIDAARIINIKPGRVGGLWNSRRMHDLSLKMGKPVWCGGMLETGIGRAANLAVSSLPGYTLPGDISASERYYEEDIIDPPFILNADSTISVPTGPGLGVSVREGLLEELTLEKTTITP